MSDYYTACELALLWSLRDLERTTTKQWFGTREVAYRIPLETKYELGVAGLSDLSMASKILHKMKRRKLVVHSGGTMNDWELGEIGRKVAERINIE